MTNEVKSMVFSNDWDIAPGNFATFANKKGLYKTGRFHHCRDEFHKVFRNSNIVFCCGKWHPSGKSKWRAISEFVDQIEKKLNLKKCSHFGPTQRDEIMWIEVAPFWMRQPMRRSLFTAILRAARKFDRTKQNYEEALVSCEYLSKTANAVKWFLEGHTWYTGKEYGWQNVFGPIGAYDSNYHWVTTPLSQEVIAKLLVKKRK